MTKIVPVVLGGGQDAFGVCVEEDAVAGQEDEIWMGRLECGRGMEGGGDGNGGRGSSVVWQLMIGGCNRRDR